MDRVLRVFDAKTEKLVDNLKSVVSVAGKVFLIGFGGKTPAEQALEDLDKADRARDLQERKGRARSDLQEAVASGDPKAVKDALKAVNDVRREEKRRGLEDEADIERAAADKKLAEDEKNLRAEREEQKLELEKRLNGLSAALAKGEISAGDARDAILGLLGDPSFQFDMEEARSLMGLAFAAGLNEALQGVVDSVAEVVEAVSTATGIATAKPKQTFRWGGKEWGKAIGKGRNKFKTAFDMNDKEFKAWSKGHPAAAALLAKGGIVTGPTLAVIGEGGQNEAVVPLDRAGEFGFGGSGWGGPVVIINVAGTVTSERDLADTIRRELLRTGRRTGSLGLS